MHVAQNGQDTYLALPVEYKHSDEATIFSTPFSYKPLACKKVPALPPPSLPLSVCGPQHKWYVTHSFIKMIMRHKATLNMKNG